MRFFSDLQRAYRRGRAQGEAELAQREAYDAAKGHRDDPEPTGTARSNETAGFHA